MIEACLCRKKLPEGTKCSCYCNKMMFYSIETPLNRSVYVVVFGGTADREMEHDGTGVEFLSRGKTNRPVLILRRNRYVHSASFLRLLLCHLLPHREVRKRKFQSRSLHAPCL